MQQRPTPPTGRAAPRRRWTAPAAAGLALGLTMVPAAPAAGGEDGDTQRLTIAYSQEVDSLNPFTAILLISTSAHRLMYNYLTMYDPETDEVVPGLAESWSPGEGEDGEPDASVWTYELRQDAEFSDGEPVTADDVVWTFNTMKEEEEGANVALANYVANLEQATAVDEHTVRLEFDSPVALGQHMRIPILPEHIWSEVDDLAEFSPSQEEDFPVVGSGPFILTEHEPSQRLVFQANEDYWDGAPGFDEIVFEYYNEQDAQVEALRSGDVDFITNITPAQAEELQGESDIAVNDGLGRRFLAFTVNPDAEAQNGDPVGEGHPALGDRVLRQAMMHAIDKDDLVERVYGGYAQPAQGYLPARFETFHYSPEGEDAFAFAPERAEEMLDEAGYEMGDDGVRVSPDGDPLELRMIVHGDQPDRVRTGESMVEWLDDIGIAVEQINVESGEVGEYLSSADYDLIFTGWSVNPDPDNVLQIHTCDARPEEPGDAMASDSWFCDEEYDELYEQQAVESDPEQRREMIREMQAILYEEAVVNTLVYPRQVEAYRTDVIEEGSMIPHPDPGGIHWGQDDYWAWWSAQPVQSQDGGGPGPWAYVAGGAVVLLVIGGAVLLLRRRAVAAEDRE